MLRDEAMVVRLSISQWTARKFDKNVTRRVAEDFGVNPDAGRYRKLLIADEAIKNIYKTATAARLYHYDQTLPWDDAGGRLLPAANFEVYSKKMRSLRTDFEASVEEFIKAYPTLCSEAQDRLGAMFNRDDYPSVRDISRKFAFSTDIEPVPYAEDFRVSLQEGDMKRVKSELEKRTQQREIDAMKDLYIRLNKVIENFADKLKDKDSIFRDSLVENVVDLVKLLPKLNIANDPVLTKLLKDTQKKICVYEPDDLRKVPEFRAQAAKDADAILKKMAGYIGS